MNIDKYEISIGMPQIVGGGAEKVVMRLSSHLLKTGKLSRVYTSSAKRNSITKNLPIEQIGTNNRAMNSLLSFICRLKNDNSKIFLLSLGFVNFAPLIRVLRPRSRIIIRIGNTVTPELLNLDALSRFRYMASLYFAQLCADAVIFQCEYMRHDFSKYFKFVSNKSHVINNFIENELWSYTSIFRPFNFHYIFVAATNKPQKALDTLLAAYALAKKNTSRLLVIAGVDSSDIIFSKLMDKYSLKDEDVVRLGFVDSIYDYIIHADICALVSRYEGFSNFLLESAAFGKRIVITDCPGGNKEFAASYHNIDWVPVDDIPAISEALCLPKRDIPHDDVVKSLCKYSEDNIVSEYMNVLCG